MPSLHMNVRNKDTHANNVALSQSTSSLSSSLSSSVVSSAVFPAALTSNSSVSDIAASDHSVPPQHISSKPRFFPLSIAPRSTTMGQATSQVPPSVPSSPTVSSVAGSKLKRAFGRRKKSQDITGLLSDTEGSTRKGKAREPTDASSVLSAISASSPPPSSCDHSQSCAGDTMSLNPKNPGVNIAPTKLGIFGKNSGQSPKAPKFSGSPPSAPPPVVPPPVPPKSVSFPTQIKTVPSVSAPGNSLPAQHPLPLPPSPPKRPVTVERLRTPLPATPSDGEGSVGELDVMKEKPVLEKETDLHKEDWRKSDSTMTSHYTIRPGALAGNRSPRPVSLAESSHSGNTIVPVNKRFSAIIMDNEFSMVEEGEGAEHEEDFLPRASPNGSLKARNRRSVSLNFGPMSPTKSKPSSPDLSPRPPASTTGHPTPGRFANDPLAARDAPALTRATANGIVAPTNSSSTSHTTTGYNIRSRLAAWTAASLASSSPPQHERPPPTSFHRRPSASPSGQPSFRQTAVSMTGSLAPAAGIAMGFGKRAVEKVVGRAWGGFSSNSSTGYSSSSSIGHSDTSLGLTPSMESTSAQPSASEKRKFRRRTGQAFSGAASFNSSSSVSDADHFSPSGPSLGTRLRGPRLNSAGTSVAGGLVFRRNLKDCVRETAIDSIRLSMLKDSDDVEISIKPLEERWLPALAVRCAQHLLSWGVQEEGLFRVSGRSSHVARLRSEFDVGADYDMANCDPGELDPHAVASIFKTYLRELPESILTATLIPFFESAMIAEEQNRTSLDSQGPTLPPSPRSGVLALRKPPSLSTLAMPSFATKRDVSESLLKALTWLIARLPRENRDLLYTVVELIRATADRSKETKMPMGNLLLVFCPSLNLNPNLLRVLCEADSIWSGEPKTSVESVASEAPEEPNAVERAPSISTSDNLSSHSTSAGASSSGDPTTEDETWTLNTPEGSLNAPADAVLDAAALDGDQTSEEAICRISTMSVVKDDDASYVSALEIPAVPTRSPSPADSSPQVPALSTSSDTSSPPSSVPVSPDVSSGDVLAAGSKASPEAPGSDDVDFSLSPRRPRVPFPTTDAESHSPLMAHRKSFTLLSFPQMRSSSTEAGPSSPSTSTWPARPKRPSLHLLFSKSVTRLTSPINGPPSAAASVPTLSLTTEFGDATHAAFSSASLCPPVLDTTISHSPMNLGFDDFTSQVKGGDDAAASKVSDEATEVPQPLHTHVRTDSYAPSVYTTPMGTTPQETPIADFYQNRSKSLISFHEDELVSPVVRARSESALSKMSATPSIELGVEVSEDWAQSVLSAARSESDTGKGPGEAA